MIMERSFFAICKNGERIDHYLFSDLTNAVIAWEKGEPDCEVIELNSHGRIVKTFPPDECRNWATEFRDSRH